MYKRQIPDTLKALKNKGLPFCVPENYFTDLNNQIIVNIKNDETHSEQFHLPILKSISKKMPYSIPENYFSAQLSIPDFPKENPFKVPDSYFTSLENRIIEKQKKTHSKKITPIKKWYNVAIAASILIFVSITSIKFSTEIFNKVHSFSNTDIAMQSISSEALSAFVGSDSMANAGVAQKSIDENQLFKNVSDEALQTFLDQIDFDDDAEYTLN